jgi:hypothetical protein
MNDIKLLDFPGLAREFQTHYKTLYHQRLQQAQQLAQRRYLQQAQQLTTQFADSEHGSDGLEEHVTELLGGFDLNAVQLPEATVRECKREAKATAAEQWAEKHQISQKLSWLPHQLLAYFGTWVPQRGEDGKYSASATWDYNTRQREDYYALGAGLLATSARTNFFKAAPKGNQQYKSPINPLVPVILAGLKKYSGIDYGSWSQEGLETLLDPELAKLVGVTVPELSLSELLALRNTALTDKVGARAGIPNNPATCTKLNHLGDTALGHLPKLAKYIVLQTWAAHPSNRSDYAILDLNNWDNIPEPLVGKDIFMQKPQQAVASFTGNDLPWEA